MFTRMVVAPFFLLTMLLYSPNILLPSQAFAGFCGCGNCWMMYAYPGYCTCGGQYPTCLTDDFDPSLFHGLTDIRPADTGSLRGEPASLAKVNAPESVIQLVSGSKCFRDKVALSLLGKVRNDFKYAPVRFGERPLD